LQPQRDVRLRGRSGIDSLLVPVARHVDAVDPAGAVAGADDVGRAVVHDRRHRGEDVDLAIANVLGRERDRRFHRDERQHLHQVVLHHVPQGAGPFVVARAPLDADGLGRGDLHVIDVAAVPHRLEHPVGEPEDEEVLHGLLAQVMIDAEDLRLVQVRVHQLVQGARAGEIGAERLLDDDAPPGVRCLGPRQSGGAEVLHDRPVHRRRNREVEERAEPAAALLETGSDPSVQPRIVHLPLKVRHVSRERRRHVVGRGETGELREALVQFLLERLVGHRRSRDADHHEARRQPLAEREAIERRQQLAPRQIAGSAEDDEGGRLGRGLDA
jgi:hypothetical protein